jgi:hypothetical protein
LNIGAIEHFITKPASVDKESSVQFHQGHENESVAGLALNISPPLELPGNISNDLFEIQFTAPSTTTGITQVPEYIVVKRCLKMMQLCGPLIQKV